MRYSAALGISVVDYPRDSRVKYTEASRKGEVEGYRDLEHWPFGPRTLAGRLSTLFYMRNPVNGFNYRLNLE